MGELDFENVVFGYGGNALFNDFSASFAKEQISCIVGPNGCGKSTLAKLAMGLIKPVSGRVLIQGRDVASLNPAREGAAIGRARAAARSAHDDGARAGGVRKVSASRAAISARRDRCAMH